MQVATPVISDERAEVNVRTAFSLPEGAGGYHLTAHIVDPQGRELASSRLALDELTDTVADETLTVGAPQRWDLDTPRLYRAVSRLYRGDRLCDSVVTRFGIRSIEVVAHKGFLLNGRVVKFKGINNHDDLGPLGAALNESALRRRLLMLKDVGANAVRTAHNMPSPELVRLCDEMGLMVIAESFDEWAGTKVANGYHKYFNEWSERDLVNLVRHFRNAPSVVMWSIGNEVPEQYNAA